MHIDFKGEERRPTHGDNKTHFQLIQTGADPDDLVMGLAASLVGFFKWSPEAAELPAKRG